MREASRLSPQTVPLLWRETALPARPSFLSRLGFEPLVWLAALAWLGLTTPAAEPQLTLCPLAHLGISWCPGCGLGRAISYALHGQLFASLQAHILGIPAILLLTGRVGTLVVSAVRPARLSM